MSLSSVLSKIVLLFLFCSLSMKTEDLSVKMFLTLWPDFKKAFAVYHTNSELNYSIFSLALYCWLFVCCCSHCILGVGFMFSPVSCSYVFSIYLVGKTFDESTGC